jgi:hypothetical protein
LDHRKKITGSRKVWRITADAPLGEIVELHPAVSEGRPRPAEASPVIIDPCPPVNLRESTEELISGVEVTDETDTMPGELFEELFKRTS